MYVMLYYLSLRFYHATDKFRHACLYIMPLKHICTHLYKSQRGASIIHKPQGQTEWHFIDSFIVCTIIFFKNWISIREVKMWNGFYVALILCKHQSRGCHLFKCLEMSFISWNLKRGWYNLPKKQNECVWN